MILIVGQNSVWQNTYSFTSLQIGSVNRISAAYASAAGKGANVARALQPLGHESLLLAYVGGPNGEKFRHACDADGIVSDFTPIAQETRMCTTLIDDARTITELVEPAPEIAEEERASFHAAFDRHLPEATALVISGTAMRGEAPDCYLEFTTRAHRAGIPVILDSYRDHGRAALTAGPEVLKINADELGELTGMPCDTPEQRARAAASIRERFGVQWTIITRGAAGAEAFEEGGSYAAPAPAVALRNAIGSGDAFTAGIVGAMFGDDRVTGWRGDLAEALRCGTAMGSANCLNIKPGEVDRGAFERICSELEVTRLVSV